MGETEAHVRPPNGDDPFSILERIVMGETYSRLRRSFARRPFSILERIVMGETRRAEVRRTPILAFQYPRTDRDG